MERDRQLYPNIARQEIREPVFIVGLPRSGTSLLHRLLSADPEHRCPLMWEVRSPSPPTRANEKRRIQKATQSCNFFNWLVPTFRYVHAIGAEVPQECVSLMTPTFLPSDQFDAMYYVPVVPRLVFFGRICDQHTNITVVFFNSCSFGKPLTAGS